MTLKLDEQEIAEMIIKKYERSISHFVIDSEKNYLDGVCGNPKEENKNFGGEDESVCLVCAGTEEK